MSDEPPPYPWWENDYHGAPARLNGSHRYVGSIELRYRPTPQPSALSAGDQHSLRHVAYITSVTGLVPCPTRYVVDETSEHLATGFCLMSSDALSHSSSPTALTLSGQVEAADLIKVQGFEDCGSSFLPCSDRIFEQEMLGMVRARVFARASDIEDVPRRRCS